MTVTATELTPSGQTIGWLIGDVAPGAQVRRVAITYQARMNDVAANTAGTAKVNTVNVRWNLNNGTNPTTVGGPWTTTSPNATATVTVVEPALTLQKRVQGSLQPQNVVPGDNFAYSLQVSNNGRANNLSPAYNVTVTDVVPTGVVVDPASIEDGGVLTGTDANGAGGTITWTFPGPIMPNASETTGYRPGWPPARPSPPPTR